MTPHIHIGDRMRISVELLEQLWNDESVDQMVLVEVKDIVTNPDRTKVLVLERAQMPVRES